MNAPKGPRPGAPEGPRPDAPEGPRPDAPEDDVEMGFFEHLGELRYRLIRAIVGVVPCVAGCWLFVDPILSRLLQPLMDAYRELGLPTQVHFANPVDPFMAKLKVAVIGGVLLGAPWIFWQLWMFISPGLYRRERFIAIPFVLASTLCFSGGALFGYLFVFPLVFQTLLEFGGELPGGVSFTPTLMISDVLTFIVRLLLAFGVTFEVPVVVTFLSVAGLVDWRQLLSFSRWWVVVSAVLAAFLTPPDVGSQMLMFVPLVSLYMVSVGISYLIGSRRRATEEESESSAG